MEEEEEEVLCYLDRVLEEEVFEYGDGELDPITPVHRQFKVRQRLDSGNLSLYWKRFCCEAKCQACGITLCMRVTMSHLCHQSACVLCMRLCVTAVGLPTRRLPTARHISSYRVAF